MRLCCPDGKRRRAQVERAPGPGDPQRRAHPRGRSRGLPGRPRCAHLGRGRARRGGYRRPVPALPEQGGAARQLARDGLRRYIEEVEAAVADEGDAWAAFAAFMERILDADVLAITIRLAGTFTPTPDLMADATRAADSTPAHRADEGGGRTTRRHRGRRPVADHRTGRVAPPWRRAADASAPPTLPRACSRGASGGSRCLGHRRSRWSSPSAGRPGAVADPSGRPAPPTT